MRGRPKNRARRIVEVHGHLDLGFFSDRDDGLEEVFQVGPQIFFADRLVFGEQRLQLLGFVAGVPTTGSEIPFSGTISATAAASKASVVEPSGSTLAISVRVQSKTGMKL